VSPCRHVLWHGLLSYCDLPCHYLLCHYVLTYLLGAPLGKTMRYVWGDWEYATLPHAFQPYPHPYPYPYPYPDPDPYPYPYPYPDPYP